MLKSHITYWSLSFFAGIFLTLMIKFNSQLANLTNPSLASLFAHGIGALFAFSIVIVLSTKISNTKIEKINSKRRFWYYLGGIPGAFTVLLSAITVNSVLGLSASLTLMLLGKMIFSLACDNFGWFQLPIKKITRCDLYNITIVFIGCIFIIFSRQI